MEIVIALSAAILFSCALRNPLRRMPGLFYVLAVALGALVLANDLPFSNMLWWRTLLPYLQRGILAFSLLVVVMFIGVLPPESKLCQWLKPIRGQLSILAAIFACAHAARHLSGYFDRLVQGTVAVPAPTVVSFVVAMVLFVLLLLLGITSFQFVKKRMDHKVWKSVQRLAYVFFILVYVHLMLILMPAAMRGGLQAIESVVGYTIIFGIYIIGRPLRAHLDAKAEAAENPAR